MSRPKIKKYYGFTIVELLIVIVVITILATISIIAYNGIQQRAHASAAQSDLANAKKQLMLAQIDTGGYPNTAGSLRPSSGTTFEITANNTTNPQTFCLTATNGNISYKITESSAPAQGSCPGHSSNGAPAITNLAVNPSAETGGTSWSPRWYGAGGGSGTTSRTSVAALFGSYGYRKTWSVGAGGQDIGFAYTQSVTPGTTYTFSAHIRSSVVTEHKAFVYWQDSSGTGVGSTTVGPIVSIQANTWQRLSVTAAAPASAAKAIFVWGPYPPSNSPGSIAGQTLDFDGVMITEGSTLYGYADGNSSNWVWNGTSDNATSTGPAL